MASATNERGLRAQREQVRRDNLTNEIITRQLMSTQDGRRWVWLRLNEAGLFINSPNLDPYQMAWEKGIRNAGLRLLADVSSITPQEYILMTEEARSITLTEKNDERSTDD